MRFLLLLALAGQVAALRRKSTSNKEGWSGFYPRRRTGSTGFHGGWKEHFKNYAETYMMQTNNPDGIAPMCHPYISEPRGTSRGLVVLQHGFTACAGFWGELAPPLVAKGWTVMVPNLPGAGRQPKVERNGSGYAVTDYTADFPDHGEEYEDFAQELMTIVKKYKRESYGKEVVVAGCSHGGGVAAYMAMRMDRGTFDRVLLMNPFLAPPTGIGMDFGLSFLRDIVPKVLPAFTPIAGDMSWGDDCNHVKWPTDIRNSHRTGGTCSFTLSNFRGVLEFGNLVEGEARERAAKSGVFTGGVVDRVKGMAQAAAHLVWNFVTGSTDVPRDMRVQVTTTDNDGAISNARVHFAGEAIAANVKPGNSALCSMPEEMQHTYINPTDKPVDSDMWWLDANRVRGGKTAIDVLNNFLSEGIHVPTRGTVSRDRWMEGDPQCDMRQQR